VGYGKPHGIKGYHLYDISNHRLFTNHDVIFHEDSLLQGGASSSPPLLPISNSDSDYLVTNPLLSPTINLNSSQNAQNEPTIHLNSYSALGFESPSNKPSVCQPSLPIVPCQPILFRLMHLIDIAILTYL